MSWVFWYAYVCRLCAQTSIVRNIYRRNLIYVHLRNLYDLKSHSTLLFSDIIAFLCAGLIENMRELQGLFGLFSITRSLLGPTRKDRHTAHISPLCLFSWCYYCCVFYFLLSKMCTNLTVVFFYNRYKLAVRDRLQDEKIGK